MFTETYVLLQTFLKMRFYYFILFLMLFAFSSFSQDTDSMFVVMKDKAYNGYRNEAREIGHNILSIEKNNDVSLLIARTFMWDSNFDSAMVYLDRVLLTKSTYYDALDAKLDLLYWKDDYEQGLLVVNFSLEHHREDENFILKKVKFLNSLNRKEEAILVLKHALIVNTSSLRLRERLYELMPETFKNKISINYTLDHFSKVLVPWHYANIQYARSTKLLGTVVARMNYANRFKTNGIQAELDAYPTLSKYHYAYFNIGYGGSGIFPAWRGGTDIYQKLPNAFEMALGFRYLNFSSSNVMIYTAYFGKYVGNYWLGVRTFITPSNNNKTSLSGTFLVRKYFEDDQNYVGLRVGYGVSPDNKNNIYYNLQSKNMRLEYNKTFQKRWVMNVSLNGEMQEYVVDNNRFVFTSDITIGRRF